MDTIDNNFKNILKKLQTLQRICFGNVFSLTITPNTISVWIKRELCSESINSVRTFIFGKNFSEEENQLNMNQLKEQIREWGWSR